MAEATGFDRRTISRRLGDLKPDKTGLYDGPPAFARIYSHKGKSAALMAAETRRKEALAALAEMDLAERKRDYLPTEDVLRVWIGIGVAIRNVIRGSHLSHSEQVEVLRQLRELKVNDYLVDDENIKNIL